MAKSLRALVGARVSVVQGPEKVSHIAQIETATKWAESKGYQVVGSFEDLGVSAGVPPAERPDLGQWLTEEGADKWDVIVWAKMDRAFRSTRHCVDFAQWAEDRHKVVVFAEDNLTLDYRPGVAKGLDAMMAELFVYIGSFFAQLERNRFKTRAQDSQRVIRGTTRWMSGPPPLGFQIVDHPSGKGKGLATDPEGKELLYQMASRLLDGWSFTRIAVWLNETATPTNKDRARNGEQKVNPWTATTVAITLTSPKTQGIKMHQKQMVLDPDGEPIRLAPPTFDAATWDQIQAAAADRRLNRRTPTGTENPMLGVGVCGQCGATLGQNIAKRGEKTYRYYRCSRSPSACRGVVIRADDGDRLMEEAFLATYGDERVTRRVFVPGEDHAYELEQLRATIDRLRRESDAGLIEGPEDEQIYFERMKKLLDRRKALEATPARVAGWTTEEDPETYREVWASQDHRKLLIDRGVRFVVYSSRPLQAGIETR